MDTPLSPACGIWHLAEAKAMNDALDFRCFSCPQVGIDDEILSLIVVDHAREIIRVLIERHGAQLDRHAIGISNLLTTWRSSGVEENFNTVWNLAFGDVHALLLSQSADDLIRCASAAALRMNECGYEGEWGTRLPVPACFRFDRWLLPASEAIEVSA